MSLLKRQRRKRKKVIIRIIEIIFILGLVWALAGCSAFTKDYDGKTLIMAIPEKCEKQWVDFYKCEMSKTFLEKLFMKKCLLEECR